MTIVVNVDGKLATSLGRRSLVDLCCIDIKARRLPKVGWPKRPGIFYVKLLVDGKVQKTADSARGDVASWTESFSL